MPLNSTGREAGAKGIALSDHVCSCAALSVSHVCARLVDMAGKQELLLQTPVHVSDGHAEDEIPLGNDRDLHPPGCFEAEKAAKLILQVICLKLYVFLMVSLSSMCHCSEMS